MTSCLLSPVAGQASTFLYLPCAELSSCGGRGSLWLSALTADCNSLLRVGCDVSVTGTEVNGPWVWDVRFCVCPTRNEPVLTVCWSCGGQWQTFVPGPRSRLSCCRWVSLEAPSPVAAAACGSFSCDPMLLRRSPAGVTGRCGGRECPSAL